MTSDELKRIPLFHGTRGEAAALLLRRGIERAYPANAVIWREGTAARIFLVLLAGTVRAVRTGPDRETVLHRSRPGATLGEVPLLDGGTYPATLVAETPVRVLVLDRATLAWAVTRDSSLAMALLQTLAHRVRVLAGRLEAQTSDPVRCRLARYVCSRSDTVGGRPFDLGMTQTQLAHELGTVREVVARGLADLVHAGMLERAGRARFTVTDGAGLLRLAGDDRM